jgi:hypothetical protein
MGKAEQPAQGKGKLNCRKGEIIARLGEISLL